MIESQGVTQRRVTDQAEPIRRTSSEARQRNAIVIEYVFESVATPAFRR
jgi:hypothetical protein